MVFDHEKLDVYRVSLEFVSWSYQLCKGLAGPDRHARDQLLRASQSISQNVAEGNGKRSGAERRRFFEIARGSAFECAAILDILSVCQVVTPPDVATGKGLLHRLVSMLSKITVPGDEVQEEAAEYRTADRDYEADYEHEHGEEEK
jgi:four helix bundle protein